MQPVMAYRIMNWQRTGQASPWELMICPTHRCNLKCGICARSWEEQHHPLLMRELSDERWLALLDEAVALGVRYLSIGGGGEPTLRRDLVMKICARAKQYGMEGMLQTNGTVLVPEDIEALIHMEWDHVTISLDGPTALINDRIRYANAYRDALERLKTLASLKRKHRVSLPNLQVNMVVTALNYDKLEDMVVLCSDIGVNSLSVKALLEYSPEMKEFILNPQQRAALPAEVEKATYRAMVLGLDNNLGSLIWDDTGDSTARHSQGNSYSAGLAGAHCLEPWRGAVVTSSGQVMPCCFFWNQEADSIREKSLSEAWYGTYLTDFRDRMIRGDLPGPCRACSFPDSQIHQQLMGCFRHLQEAGAYGGGWNGRAGRLWILLRTSGTGGIFRRYQEWRKIRRALRKEQ